MNLWIFLLCICFIAVVYLNFLEEIKVGKDLEILEMDYMNNSYLQEICRSKQPIYFLLRNGIVLPDSNHLCTFDLAAFTGKYGKEKVVIYESPVRFVEKSLLEVEKGGEGGEEREGGGEGGEREGGAEASTWWSENNSPFIEETPLQRYFKYCDAFLAPFGTVATEYDFWMGSVGAIIPTRYHRRHSYFLYVMQGEITLNLAPFKALGPGPGPNNLDYVMALEEDEKEVSWMDVNVSTGYCLFVPPYWWHQTHFNQPDTLVAVFMYDNFMNSIITQISSFY